MSMPTHFVFPGYHVSTHMCQLSPLLGTEPSMSLRQEESLSLSSILAPSPLPPTLSRREAKRISAKKSYEKHKIQIRARDVKRKRKQWKEKTEDERNILRENGRVTQRAWRARRSPEEKVE